MNAPSIDTKDMLTYVTPSASSGDTPINEFGLVFGTNLFVGKEPALPDETVTIFDVIGWPPQLTFIKGEEYDSPSIQIRVRSRDYVGGWNLLDAIKRKLHGTSQETWNGTLYSMIRCSRAPMLLDWDENSRVRFIASFEMQRRSV